MSGKLVDRWAVRLLMLLILLAGSMGAAPVPARGQASELNRIVEGLNASLASLRDMSADFVQIVEQGIEPETRLEGHVYLARGGRSRWEYAVPESELYISTGDVAIEYKAGQNLMRIRPIGPEAYDRLPLMSVLGRRNLVDEFGRFQLLDPSEARVEGTVVVRAYPERDTDIEYIVIEAEPRFFVIRRLLMKFRNPTTNDFVFNNVLTNTGLGEALWEFEPPAGTEVVDLVN